MRVITFKLESTNCEDGGIWDDVEKDGKNKELELRRRCISKTLLCFIMVVIMSAGLSADQGHLANSTVSEGVLLK